MFSVCSSFFEGISVVYSDLVILVPPFLMFSFITKIDSFLFSSIMMSCGGEKEKFVVLIRVVLFLTTT